MPSSSPSVMKYFAYGTNLNPKIMTKKSIAWSDRRAAVLAGYALRFNKKNERENLPQVIGFANIEPSPQDRVEGALYELEDVLLSQLDRMQRCPDHYERIHVEVQCEGQRVPCFTYRARPEWTAEGLIPSQNYINHILAGQELLSTDYVEHLDQLETYAGECAACHRVTTVLFHKEAGRLFVLCTACLEAKRIWSATLGRRLTVLDTESVMQHVMRSEGYPSIQALMEAAVRRGLIDP